MDPACSTATRLAARNGPRCEVAASVEARAPDRVVDPNSVRRVGELDDVHPREHVV